MAGALAPQKACHGMLAQRLGRCGRALAVAPQAVAAVEAPSAKQSKPDGVMGQGPIIINGQVHTQALQWRRWCSADAWSAAAATVYLCSACARVPSYGDVLSCKLPPPDGVLR